jgi:hypothetical protein
MFHGENGKDEKKERKGRGRIAQSFGFAALEYQMWEDLGGQAVIGTQKIAKKNLIL